MINKQDLVKQSIELISLPDIYIRLKSVLDSPNTSMSDVAMVIAHDPALSARLLKLVNSSFYGYSSKIDTITRAVNMLGTQHVHDLALATTIVDSFSGFTNDVINIYDFWYNSVYCAVMARLLAFYSQMEDTERPFVAGLLHDIGHLVMYQALVDESRQAIAEAEEKSISLAAAEQQLIGFDYADLGADLMHTWNLPESLQQMTRHHPMPENAKDFKQEVCLIHVASSITQAVIKNIPISDETIHIANSVWKTIGLTLDDMPAIKQDADQQVNMVMDLIFSKAKIA